MLSKRDRASRAIFLTASGRKAEDDCAILGLSNGLTWSADDKKLIYSLLEWSSYQLGEVTVANGSVKRLASKEAQSCRLFPPEATNLPIALFPCAQHLAQGPASPGSSGGRTHPFLAGTVDAQYSPDGKRIAFASKRSGRQGVWISSDDGSNLVQISNPHDESGSPQWSPDGRG